MDKNPDQSTDSKRNSHEKLYETSCVDCLTPGDFQWNETWNGEPRPEIQVQVRMGYEVVFALYDYDAHVYDEIAELE